MSLEQRFFDPLAFGGATFLIGGVLIGSIYPFANVQEWQRVFSCKDSKIAKRAYLYGIPLVFFYVGSAVFFGLAAKVLLPNVSSEQALLELINKTLPVGVIGISFACIISVIMSSVDSLLVGATATLANDILPHIKISNNQSKEKYLSISSLRVVSFLITLPCALIVYLYPSIVSLSIIASFLLLCFSSVIILGLLGVKLTQKKVINSMILGIIGLFVGWYYLGTSSFLVIFFGAVVGILI